MGAETLRCKTHTSFSPVREEPVKMDQQLARVTHPYKLERLRGDSSKNQGKLDLN